MSSNVKKASIISLKWPINVPGGGCSRYVQCATLRTVNGVSECRVTSVRLRKKWVVVAAQVVWINDDCVVSRQYVDELPEQARLELENV